MYGFIFHYIKTKEYFKITFLYSVLLRQNPHNVHEWHKRVKLLEGKPKEVCTFEKYSSFIEFDFNCIYFFKFLV